MTTNSDKTALYNKIFLVVVFGLIIISVVVTYIKIVTLKDYQIVAETSCDPTTESCFVYVCDPADDTECPVDETERISYYKMVSKKAANIAVCEATTEKVGCDTELSCVDGEESCSYTYCDPENLAEGEECSE